MPEVSVIMPVYNAQQYLNQSIHSVLNQSFTNFELLLVNDGSTDYSLLFCRALAEKDRRIRVLDLPHGGEAAARAEGVQAARGSYISFVDADDWVEKDFLKHLYTAITESKADIAMCGMAYDGANGSVICKYTFDNGVYSHDSLEALKKSKFLSDKTDRSICVFFSYLCDKLFRTELIRSNLHYMDKRVVIGPDVLLSTACFLDCRFFNFHDYIDYHYCQRAGSVVHSQQKRCLEEKLNELKIFRTGMLNILKDKGYADLSNKVDTINVYRLYSLFRDHEKEENIPICSELKELLQSQSENDGCDKWAEAVRFVKAYIE